MRPRQHGCSGWRLAVPWLALLFAGCGHVRGIDRALLADQNSPSHRDLLAAHYIVRCPDVLAFQVDGFPSFDGEHAVGADGRVWFGKDTPLRVDGKTVAEIAAAAHACLGVPVEDVHVRVADFKSQQLYLFGEVNGLQQAVPYEGPETVLDLLQRVGGITSGAAPRDVEVVRAHVADSKKPEVFHVDLTAIVLRHEQKMNITLEPFDKIYVGQTGQSKVGQCLPPWLRKLHEAVWGM